VRADSLFSVTRGACVGAPAPRERAPVPSAGQPVTACRTPIPRPLSLRSGRTWGFPIPLGRGRIDCERTPAARSLLCELGGEYTPPYAVSSADSASGGFCLSFPIPLPHIPLSFCCCYPRRAAESAVESLFRGAGGGSNRGLRGWARMGGTTESGDGQGNGGRGMKRGRGGRAKMGGPWPVARSQWRLVQRGRG